MKNLFNFWKAFYDAIVSLSGVYYPTSLLDLHNLVEISQLFSMTRNDELFKPSIEVIERKFKKYWCETPLFYSFAFVLDPRIKVQGLNKCFVHIGAYLDLDLFCQYININNTLFEVYSIYENKFGNLRNKQTQKP